MNNDFKKGFSSTGLLAALLIPTLIYFLDSNFLKRSEASKEYTKWMYECIQNNLSARDYSKGVELFGTTVDNTNKESYFKIFCKKNDYQFWNAWNEKQSKK